MRYPISISGVTIDLPDVHRLTERGGVIRFRFRCQFQNRFDAAKFDGIGTVSGPNVTLVVTAEEARQIRVMELLRRRDSGRQTIRAAEWQLQEIDRRLRELGYDSATDDHVAVPVP